MTSNIRVRLFQYAVYFAVIFLVALTIPSPHDSLFFGIIIGVIVLNVVFAVWLLDFNLIVRIISGLVIPNLAIYAAYSIPFLFVSNIPGTVMPAIVFSVLFSIVSICLWELFITVAKRAKIKSDHS